MTKPNASPLGPAEREALADQLIRVIGTQLRALVGTELNWIQLAADAIIDRFEAEGIFGTIDIWPDEISALIDGFLTPESKGRSYTVARRIIFELGHFKDQRDSAQAESDALAAGSQIPTDETHEFALGFKELYEHLGEPSSASEILTEAEALAKMAKYKEDNGVQRLILLARPKPQPWAVLDYRG